MANAGTKNFIGLYFSQSKLEARIPRDKWQALWLGNAAIAAIAP
jgi:hypothetical protein